MQKMRHNCRYCGNDDNYDTMNLLKKEALLRGPMEIHIHHVHQHHPKFSKMSTLNR